jgi:murein DD-endopeptidase MepM/ murein hydrolase activator NlpD
MRIFKYFTAIAVASLTAATPAAAQTPGGDASAGTSPEAGTDAPTAAAQREEQSALASERKSRLRVASVNPRVVWFAGRRAARIRFELAGKRKRDVQVQLVHRQGKGKRKVVRRWGLEGVPGGERQEVRWNGRKRNGAPVAPGRYAVRVMVKGEGLADASRAQGKRTLRAYPHIFPVRGPHTYGDGIGAGRGHRGQDVFARCGTKLVAARAGKVRYRGYQGSAAGHYVVISGARTGMEYVYMHLRGRAKVREGQRVRTGQVIGRVGQSGNATGCHLHFELWSAPGWYRGGSHMPSVTRKLRRWDRWG